MSKRSGEFPRIERIAHVLRDPHAFGRGIDVGIGDDAAVLAPPPESRIVATVDEQVEGTHFRRDLLSLREIGARSLIAATSDVLAMGARPWCALSALSLPESMSDGELDELVRGQREAASKLGLSIVGGNLTKGPVLCVTTTVLGLAERCLLRGGASVGEGVYLLGDVGAAALGFRALSGIDSTELDWAIHAWRCPPVHLQAVESLQNATSAIDISDGLAQDAGHLAKASNLRVVLDEEAIVSHVGRRFLRACERVGLSWRELVLHGGEDYALLATAKTPIPGFTKIGTTVAGEGVVLESENKTQIPVYGGYDHFE